MPNTSEQPNGRHSRWRWLETKYIARKVSAAEFSQRGPFIMLASQVSQARKHMGRYSLAMAKLPGGEWIALATERNLLRLNLASAEQLQDHDCGILK